MAAYSFRTRWRLEAPIDRVFGAIRDSLAWPSWWDAVIDVREIEPGEPNGTGNLRRYVMRGRLPYALAFDTRVTRLEAPTTLAGTATGELEGIGVWTLREVDGWTDVRYDWDIRTTRAFMNLAAPLPFVRQIFELNHDAVMRSGLRGISGLLGCRGLNIRDGEIAAAPAG
jgi:uncharacterized protein YndB with AHSA1/START domain